MQMQSGLHGKLEELGLDEILQLVGVSRRTGILTLKSRGREAVLQFRDGLLVRARSTGFQQSLGEMLVRHGAATPDMVQQALVIQQQERFKERIGSILHTRFKVDLLIIEQTMREQINNVLMTLFAWTDGTFDCTACEVETVDGAYLDPVQLLLEMGDAALEQLAAAGIRVQQELGAASGNPPLATDLQPATQPAPEAKLPVLVMVDDDQSMSEAVCTALQPYFRGVAFEKTEEALVQLDSLYRKGDRPVVLIDLIMPKMDGTGVLGGLELVQLLHRNFKGFTCIAIADFQHDEAIQEVISLGYHYLVKPRRGKTTGESFNSFMQQLQSILQTGVAAVQPGCLHSEESLP
jgi:CheY-like chemotaxis protein